MSEKGITSRMFPVSMESSTTAYVLCGVIAMVFWKIISIYMAKSMDPKAKDDSKGKKNGQVRTGAASDAGKRDDISSVGSAGDARREKTVNGALLAGRCDHDAPSEEETSTPDQDEEDFGRLTNGDAEPGEGVGEDLTPSRGIGEGAWIGEEELIVVSLLDSGWTEEELDARQLPIELYGWFVCRQSCGCTCELNVNLRDSQERCIIEHQYSHNFSDSTEGVYKKVSLIFGSYGSGVRHVTYCHRRRKNQGRGCSKCRASQMYCGLRKALKNKVT